MVATVTIDAVPSIGAEGHLSFGSSGANGAGVGGFGECGGCAEGGHQNENWNLFHVSFLKTYLGG
jgi:hypothetical protein